MHVERMRMRRGVHGSSMLGCDDEATVSPQLSDFKESGTAAGGLAHIEAPTAQLPVERFFSDFTCFRFRLVYNKPLMVRMAENVDPDQCSKARVGLMLLKPLN